MTTEIDPDLTGAAFDLANAGYAPMQDPEKREDREPIGVDSESLREAAERRSEADRPVMVREYVDGAGKRAAPNEAVSLARAARDHVRVRAAEARASQDRSSEQLARQVDALRATVQANDPSAAGFYGFEDVDGQPSAGKADGTDAGAAGEVRGEDTSDRLAPELERALQHPQVLQAIEERIADVEKDRRSYRDGLAAAVQIAQSTFLAQFPEFSGLTPDQLPAALEKMSREDPAKLARVQAAVATSEQLLAQQAHQQQRDTEIGRQNFQKFAQNEDARLEVMLKGEPKSVQQAVAAEILLAAKETGIEPAELSRLFQNEPVMRNATFQRMMYDAAKYRLMMKSKDTIAARPMPPVLRPGIATSPAERDRSDLRTLSARLSSSGDLKDAVALYQARRSNRPS